MCVGGNELYIGLAWEGQISGEANNTRDSRSGWVQVDRQFSLNDKLTFRAFQKVFRFLAFN